MTSALEQALAQQIAWAGLPQPETEFKAIEGRKFRFDLAWPSHRLLLEINGGVWGKSGKGGASAHSGGMAANRDAEKSNLAVLDGWRVLTVTSNHITSGQALRWVQIALAMAPEPITIEVSDLNPIR